jgi:hypothetical protein
MTDEANTSEILDVTSEPVPDLPFQVGDLVYVKGQEIVMTVEAIFDGGPHGLKNWYAAVVWFVDDMLQRAQFDARILEVESLIERI